MRSTGSQLADVLVPLLAILTVGGAVTFFVWKAFQAKGDDSGARLSGPPAPPKFKPLQFDVPQRRLRRRKKDYPKFYRSKEAFTRDDSEGYDLEVED